MGNTLENERARANDVQTLAQLNRSYVRAALASDGRWFDAHLAACFMASSPDGSLEDRALRAPVAERGPACCADRRARRAAHGSLAMNTLARIQKLLGPWASVCRSRPAFGSGGGGAAAPATIVATPDEWGFTRFCASTTPCAGSS